MGKKSRRARHREANEGEAAIQRQLKETVDELQNNHVLMDAIQRVMFLPPSADLDPELDLFTCSHCGKHSTQRLLSCARCHKQAYCDKHCQRQHWKYGGHKQACVPLQTALSADDSVSGWGLPLTWKQLETFGREGQRTPKNNPLQVRIVSFECVAEDAWFTAVCYDRSNEGKRVRLPGELHSEVEQKCSLYRDTCLEWSRPRLKQTQLETFQRKNGEQFGWLTVDPKYLKDIRIIASQQRCDSTPLISKSRGGEFVVQRGKYSPEKDSEHSRSISKEFTVQRSWQSPGGMLLTLAAVPLLFILAETTMQGSCQSRECTVLVLAAVPLFSFLAGSLVVEHYQSKFARAVHVSDW